MNEPSLAESGTTALGQGVFESGRSSTTGKHRAQTGWFVPVEAGTIADLHCHVKDEAGTC